MYIIRNLCTGIIMTKRKKGFLQKSATATSNALSGHILHLLPGFGVRRGLCVIDLMVLLAVFAHRNSLSKRIVRNLTNFEYIKKCKQAVRIPHERLGKMCVGSM